MTELTKRGRSMQSLLTLAAEAQRLLRLQQRYVKIGRPGAFNNWFFGPRWELEPDPYTRAVADLIQELVEEVGGERSAASAQADEPTK